MVDSNVLFGSFEKRRMEGFRGKKYIEKWGNLLYFFKEQSFRES